MTRDEYYNLRILLEKWAHHKDPPLPSPFNGVGVQVSKRAGLFIMRHKFEMGTIGGANGEWESAMMDLR
jgi:hypothetical protein